MSKKEHNDGVTARTAKASLAFGRYRHVRAKYNPLESHFYMVKLWYVGVYLFFLIFGPKHTLWVLVRTASARWF